MKTPENCTFAIFVFAFVGMIGCTENSTGLPPEPESVHGETAGNEHYTFLAWKNGLRLLVVDDFRGPINRKSDFSLGDESPYVFSENVKTEEIEMSWAMQTQDGKTGRFTLDGDEYDLTDGSVFVARQGADGFVVEQINADVSMLEPKTEAIGSFVSQNLSQQAD